MIVTLSLSPDDFRDYSSIKRLTVQGNITICHVLFYHQSQTKDIQFIMRKDYQSLKSRSKAITGRPLINNQNI